MRVFAFSKETIHRKKKHVLILQLLTPIFIFAFVFIGIAEDKETFAKIWISLLTIIVMGSLLLFLSNRTFKKWRDLKITISDDTIESNEGKSGKSISLRDITDMAVKENKLGNITYIDLNSSSQQMFIKGFENMDFLYNEIARKIPEQTKIQIRKESIDWENPLIFLFTAIAVTFATLAYLIYAYKYFGENFLFILFGLYILLKGIFGITYLLISKSVSARDGMSEIIWKIVYIIVGSLVLIGAMRFQL